MYAYASTRPIDWDGRQASIVIALRLGPDDRRLLADVLEPLSTVLVDADASRELARCRDYGSFVDRMSEFVS